MKQTISLILSTFFFLRIFLYLRPSVKFTKQDRRKTLGQTSYTRKYLILVSSTPKIQNDHMAIFWKTEDFSMPVFKKYQMKMCL